MLQLEIEGQSFSIKGMTRADLVAKLESQGPVVITQTDDREVILGNTQGVFYSLCEVEDSATIG